MAHRLSQSAPVPERVEVLVIGAGLAGLSCARLLRDRGIDVHVVEASDAPGGRIRTDEVEGFRLDRGFQVLLTAYDEVRVLVELQDLELQLFKPGSLVWNGAGLQRMTDPFRDPAGALAAVGARVGSLGDKIKVASLRRRLLAGSAQDCFTGPDRSTLEELGALGFSDAFIDGFFRPFLGGVFLERDLQTTASLFRYYFRCFASGDAAVPSKGMQRLAEAIAAPLEGRISFDSPVREVRPGSVTLDDGGTVDADEIVVAVDGVSAARLLGGAAPTFKSAITAYYAAPDAPIDEALLVLDGEGTGPVNHVAVMSNVAPSYAPAGMHLVAVSGVAAAADDPSAFRAAAPAQMRRWFGDPVDRWTHLRTYRIERALPSHPAGSLARSGKGGTTAGVRDDGLVIAGDWVEFGAIQGALLSGRRAAEEVVSRLSEPINT